MKPYWQHWKNERKVIQPLRSTMKLEGPKTWLVKVKLHFSWMESKWVDLYQIHLLISKNNLFEAEGYNNSFRFIKAKHAIDNVESRDPIDRRRYQGLQSFWSEEQEQKSSGRVVHFRYKLEELQKEVSSDRRFWQCASWNWKQIEISSIWVFAIVTLNSFLVT